MHARMPTLSIKAYSRHLERNNKLIQAHMKHGQPTSCTAHTYILHLHVPHFPYPPYRWLHHSLTPTHPHPPTPPSPLTLHCCSSSSIMCTTEEGPPRDPNRSRPSIASRAAWCSRGWARNLTHIIKLQLKGISMFKEVDKMYWWNMHRHGKTFRWTSSMKIRKMCVDESRRLRTLLQRECYWSIWIIYIYYYVCLPHTLCSDTPWWWSLFQSVLQNCPCYMYFQLEYSPWPCQWSWHSARAPRCWSCHHAPKYHSPTYVRTCGGVDNKQTNKKTNIGQQHATDTRPNHRSLHT